MTVGFRPEKPPLFAASLPGFGIGRTSLKSSLRAGHPLIAHCRILRAKLTLSAIAA